MTIRSTVLDWLESERTRQIGLWGEQIYPPRQWITLLAEELGEAAREVNHGDLNLREYQDQLLHIAAVAIAALEDLGLWDPPSCLTYLPIDGANVEDKSPYPRGHFHRRLASITAHDLQSELALRWAFGLKHAKVTGQGVDSYATLMLMSLLDDVRALGISLPDSVKPIAADLGDVVAGLVAALEKAGVIPASAAKVVDQVEAITDPSTPVEPPTVGSLVVDASPTGPPPDPLASLSVEELTAELAKRQSDAVKTADAQKSTVGPLEPLPPAA